MGYKKRESKKKYESALYRIWSEMIRRARQTVGMDGDIPIDPMFLDWAKFETWAMFNGYRAGMELCTRDSSLPKSPENCFWSGNVSMGECSNVVVETPWHSRDTETKGRAESKWGGIHRQRLYNIWRGMIRRCGSATCKDYPDYGGRGITVCEEWKNFLAFYEWSWNHGYAPTMSIDRIDVNKGYSPSNCRWATPLEQTVNVRAYDGRYTTLRLHADEAARYLETIDGESVVTLIIRTDAMTRGVPEQCDYGAVPVEYRRDKRIGEGK